MPNLAMLRLAGPGVARIPRLPFVGVEKRAVLHDNARRILDLKGAT